MDEIRISDIEISLINPPEKGMIALAKCVVNDHIRIGNIQVYRGWVNSAYILEFINQKLPKDPEKVKPFCYVCPVGDKNYYAMASAIGKAYEDEVEKQKQT